MSIMLLASTGGTFAAGFGVAAAVLAVGGFILVRLRRDRYHFDLMRTALEQGMAGVPNSIPFWLVSLRQGIVVLTLGVALLAVGAVGYGMAVGVKAPETGLSPITASSPFDGSAQTEKQAGRVRGARDNRPPPSPETERWRRAEQQRSISLVVMGCGAVLLPLGVVRIAFARVERRYAIVPDGAGPPKP